MIQVVLKLFLGALRPYFLEVCRPPSNVLDNARNAFRSKPDHALTNLIWASTSMCTGDPKDIRNAMESYPSGHTATAFTVGFFLALYLNSKTKAFADYQTGYWKMFIVIVPILGACLASSLVVIDGVREHNIICLKSFCCASVSTQILFMIFDIFHVLFYETPISLGSNEHAEPNFGVPSWVFSSCISSLPFF